MELAAEGQEKKSSDVGDMARTSEDSKVEPNAGPTCANTGKRNNSKK